MRFHAGQRVRYTGLYYPTMNGLEGTVVLMRGFYGSSIHPDPARLMVAVQWDDGTTLGVFKREVEAA